MVNYLHDDDAERGITAPAKGYRERLHSIGGESWSFGCNPAYFCSIPGFLRLFNIILGIITLGLWVPGYPHDFRGEIINPLNRETSGGYGNGWRREPLNQFVLAAICICLICSTFLFGALICTKTGSVDWNRFNKMTHLVLSILLFGASFSSIFGAWYFVENCCHVRIDWDGLGLSFSMAGGEYYYPRHCYCYLTRYLSLGPNVAGLQKETILYEASKNPDLTNFDHNWSFAAHDMEPHVAAIFILFLNSFVYFLAFVYSKIKRN